MTNVLSIFKREFLAYFNSAIANICIVAFLVIVSSVFFFWPGSSFFFAGQASNTMPWMFLIFVPAITMRLWAEEKERGTIEILMTLPIKDWEAVFGKYLASLAFLSLMVLVIGLGVVAGAVVRNERYQAALREAYPAVTLFEEHFSATQADPADVNLAKDGAVAYAVVTGIAVVGLWGGVTLWVIGTIHAKTYSVHVPPLPGW